MPILEPVTPQLKLHAFTGFGIELEYMIVDLDTLAVRPWADRLLIDEGGEVVNEIEHGELAWSNELVAHVIELKTNGPANSLVTLGDLFHRDVLEITRRLSGAGARLMPTAMHPLFDPSVETRLWPHGQNEIYAAYDRIFGCHGHGWSNLQSMHINLPFHDDEEFRRLHAAIRVVLPLIPALAAASPLEQGRRSAWMDGRLRYYRDNQRAVPEISGPVIPEPVGSIDEYHERILKPMYGAIARHDPEDILADDWLNSRAAIARFERQTIEIRIIDLQECPAADLAIAEIVVALVKALYEERLATYAEQQAMDTEVLARLLWQAAAQGSSARLEHHGYARLLGVRPDKVMAATWIELVHNDSGISIAASRLLEHMIKRGTLAQAIIERLGDAPERAAIEEVYRELCTCLLENRLFLP
jgi:glutamate---cysteine ligase / carboxylate-amine ligase